MWTPPAATLVDEYRRLTSLRGDQQLELSSTQLKIDSIASRIARRAGRKGHTILTGSDGVPLLVKDGSIIDANLRSTF